MPRDLIQDVKFPGVTGVASAQYVCSHGTTPGRAVLVTYPQFVRPEEFGDLEFSDGTRTVKIRNCKVDSVTPQSSTGGGTVYTLDILDERWTWSLGGISGHYNQKDKRGKLVPWTIRSPEELAKLCLKEMGVGAAFENFVAQVVQVNNFASGQQQVVARFDPDPSGYVLKLPPGLTKAAGEDVERYLKQGENFPQSLTNPEVVWDHTPPAEALSQLAEQFGCRVIYQPVARRVLVVPLGEGRELPTLPYESVGQTITSPEAPARVGVFGAPVKIQARFMLEAVGEEWDGSYLPIDQLSYAPVMVSKKQISRIEKAFDDTGKGLEVKINYHDKTGVNVMSTFLPSGVTTADKFSKLAALVAADADAGPVFGLTTDATSCTFAYKRFGDFSLTARPTIAGAPLAEPNWHAVVLVQAGGNNKASWNFTNPPHFSNVQATNRLSYQEAKSLAQKTVFRCYRILNRDPHDKSPKDKPGRAMVLPWWGKIKRRQQIVLQDTKVEQVKPAPRIPGAVNRGAPVANVAGQGVLPEFYNGYSRDQPATVRGSIATQIGNVMWIFAAVGNALAAAQGNVAAIGAFNTEETDRVFVEFNLNEVEQLVTFGEPVYYFTGAANGGTIREPDLVLETGCYVLHPDTNAPVRWEDTMRVPGGTGPTQWVHRDDVQVGVVGVYAEKDKLLEHEFADVADAKARIGYYLRGQALNYRLKGGETRQYVGIVPHDPDGYTQQVSWLVGESGPTTVVSANTEHNPVIPPYPARRRAESLPPDKAAAAANQAEWNLMFEAAPKEAK